MAEQQLIDYIKKAREAGQADGQTRSLLYKNGWTATEVDDAFVTFGQPQPTQQPQSQPKPQPQAQAQPVKSNAQNDFSYQRKSHKFLNLAIVSIIVVVLCGVGYFTVGQYLNLPYSNLVQNFFRPNPETVINNMLQNLGSVKSSHSVSQVMIGVVDNNNVSQGTLSVNSNSESDITNVNSPKAGGTITISLNSPYFPASQGSISANINIVTIGGAFYLKINSISIPSAVSYPGIDVSKVIGKWFKIDKDSINTLSQVQGAQVNINNVAQNNSSDLVKKIQALLSTEKLFTVSKQLNDENISGQNTYHYLVNISKDKLKDLMNKVVNLEIQTFIGTFLDDIGDINMEMWIGQTDNMLYQTKIDKVIDLGKILGRIGYSAQNSGIKLEIKNNTTNSNFNKPISVQAPQDSQKLEEVLLPIIKTQMVASDIKQIASLSALLFQANKSYSSLCYSNLLNGYLTTYGSGLISLNNDIVKQGGKKPICLSEATSYCISTQLSDGSYICADDTGTIGTTKCVSSKTVCK